MEIDIAWSSAEESAFNAMAEHLNHTPGRECFLGAMPDSMTNVWMFTSGGGGDADVTEIMAGTVACYDELVMDATAECRYETRRMCQDWAMSILQLLRDGVEDATATNLHHVGNIHMLNPTGLPTDPTPAVFGDGVEAWTCSIPFQLVFRTSADLG